MNPWPSNRLPKDVWILDGDDNADRLLAKWTKLLNDGYEDFLIAPPLTKLQGLGSVLSLTFSETKSAIEEGTS